MKTNLFNTTGEYTAPECKSFEIQLERNFMVVTDSGNGNSISGDKVSNDSSNWG